MKNFLFSFFIFGIILISADINLLKAQDVSQVGKNVYKLLGDTLGIRMYEVTFKPGDKVAFHTHPDHTVYALEGGSLEVTHVNGEKEVIDLKPGMAAIFATESHSAMNPGKTTVKAIVTEIWRPRK